MAKLSQKELVEEGISGLIAKGLKKSAQAVGAVGGALKAVSDAGIDAGVGNVVRGAKAGSEGTKRFLTGKNKKLNDTIEELGYIKVGVARGAGDIRAITVKDLDYNAKGKVEAGEKTYQKPLILKWDKDSKSWSQVRSPKDERIDDKNSKEEKPKENKEAFTPKVGQEVLVRTKKSPTGEAGVVKRLNPNGRITIATAGNKAGYAFDPKNVLPSPRVKNEKSSQINLLRQLTLICD